MYPLTKKEAGSCHRNTPILAPVFWKFLCLILCSLLVWSTDKSSCSNTTRRKSVSSGKAKTCLNKRRMQQGKGTKTGQSVPKQRSVNYMLWGGYSIHCHLSDFQKAAPALCVEGMSITLCQPQSTSKMARTESLNCGATDSVLLFSCIGKAGHPFSRGQNSLLQT